MRALVSAKNFAVAALLLGAVTAPGAAQVCGPPEDDVPAVRESLLVSTAWLAAHQRKGFEAFCPNASFIAHSAHSARA